jgi:hypothetical protein
MTEEERGEALYVPSEQTAFLGWWEGEAYRTVTGRVESLSFRGAVLLVDEFLPAVKDVFLCLASPVPSDWFPANVTDVAPKKEGGQWVRVALNQPLPYELFKKLGLGHRALN